MKDVCNQEDLRVDELKIRAEGVSGLVLYLRCKREVDEVRCVGETRFWKKRGKGVGNRCKVQGNSDTWTMII